MPSDHLTSLLIAISALPCTLAAWIIAFHREIAAFA
jgi:hypothetical protein